MTERVFRSLEFDQPVELVAIPGTNRLAVVEVNGKIYSIEDRPDADDAKRDLFADIKPREPAFTRLYGLTFHPQFAENRYCYVSYVLKPKTPDGFAGVAVQGDGDRSAADRSRVGRDRHHAGLAAVTTGRICSSAPTAASISRPATAATAFPPDGRNTGQDLSDLEASILRIDVDHPEAGRPYRIPPDNPFVDLAGARGEIWAYGLRNPWKMCFDPADGSLWVGDVGWEMWEMIYRVERGGNYGWSVVEGPQPVHERTAAGADADPAADRRPQPHRGPLDHRRLLFDRRRGCRSCAGPISMATTSPARSGACSTTAARSRGARSWSIRRCRWSALASITRATC